MDTPVLIPNTEVNHFSGDNILACLGEDSSLPVLLEPSYGSFFLFVFSDNIHTLILFLQYNICRGDLMYKLLVVDDEERIRSLIKKYAQFEGYEIVEAFDGLNAIELCKSEVFDLIIMDIMMPNLDGFSAVKEIRKYSSIPVIMLSARGEEYDRIHGFEVGVDDYVVKPFSPKELFMRVSAILKRVQSEQSKHKDVFEYKDLKVDFTARKVFLHDEEIELSPKEYMLLFYLVRNAGIALTREQLIHDVWGYDFYGDDRTLDTHIKLLRKSLKDYNVLIVTLRGVGYRFEIEN